MTENHQYKDFESFFEMSRSGFLITDVNGVIVRANQRISSWLLVASGDLEGKRVSTLLTIGGRIYYETHLWPLLTMQGYFDEVALELSIRDGTRLPILVNALKRLESNGSSAFVQFTFVRASERLLYEQDLRDARALAENKLSEEKEISAIREQFIAVLGHDLRNPLGAILAGAELLKYRTLSTDAQEKLIVMIHQSGLRMSGMIHNIMDFARARLGSGISVDMQPTDLRSVLMHATDELKVINPDQVINTSITLSDKIICDPSKIAQLYSNLLANAITHGEENGKISVSATIDDSFFQLSISNTGKPINPDIIHSLFQPFTREKSQKSQQGLGLGLYIASEIAKAHNGTLTGESNESETKFQFRMPII